MFGQTTLGQRVYAVPSRYKYTCAVIVRTILEPTTPTSNLNSCIMFGGLFELLIAAGNSNILLPPKVQKVYWSKSDRKRARGQIARNESYGTA